MSHAPESHFSKWIKKYKYLNIALIYLGTALVVIHFAEAIVHGLHMPALTFSLIVVLALAGLPIVLIIAWAMGNKQQGATANATNIIKQVKKSWLRIITASVFSIVLFAAAIFLYNKFFYHSKFTGKEKSIAVLPFTNMSNDKENEYFSDGMTEEITTQLSKIAELKVIARTSSMQYKNSNKSIKEIAQELGVSSLLEGSVQKTGNQIRITAQLIDANTQEHIWAEKYDREFKDVFDIQSEVAQEIAYQLNARLSKEEKKKIELKPTSNTQAYEYFIQGNQMREKLLETLDTNYYINGKALLEKAILLDPNYAQAHAGLAHLCNTYTQYIKEDSVLANLQVAEINKGISLSPDDDYINAMKGVILYTTLNNFEDASKSLRKAYEINPNNTNTLYELGLLQSDVGLYNERITLLQRAVRLDPLNSVSFGFLGGAKVHLNRLNEGIQDMQTALHLEPKMFYVIDRTAYVYALQDSLKAAEKWLKDFFSTIPEERKKNFFEGYGQYAAYCYAKLGNKSKALEISRHWRVLLALGMKEEAIQKMLEDEKNTDKIYNDYLVFKSHLPHKDFDIVRNDPRFLELMERKRVQFEINKKKFSVANLIN